MSPWYRKSFGREYLALYPHRNDAEAGEDEDGQIVIYTGLRIVKGDKKREKLERFELDETDD